MTSYMTQPKYKKIRDSKIPLWKRIFWGDRRWAVEEDWLVSVSGNRFGERESIVIPKGFVTDGGTIPRPLWWYVKPWNRKFFPAYLVHDYLLWSGRNSRFADTVFYNMLLDLGCNHSKALTMYHAVIKWHEES